VSRVLVTGASGFLGRALVAALTGAGYRVRAAVRRRAELFAAGVEVVVHPDLAETFDWSPLLADVDAVAHLAGIAHAGGGIPEDAYERINHRATADLAAAARRADVKRFVFVSSIRAQSGPTAATVLTERDEPRPTDAYGRSKLAAEAAVRAAGVPHTILRPVLVHAEGVKGNFATLARIARLPCPLPFGALRNLRSLVAREDLISAIRLALESPAMRNETFIVAHPKPSTPAEMIAALRTGLGRAPWLFSVPPVVFAAAFRLAGRAGAFDSLAGSLVASPGKLMAAGWRPAVEARAGLADLAAPLAAPTPRKTRASQSPSGDCRGGTAPL
jgi:nucleoside-diphosphate-sugar epimerase